MGIPKKKGTWFSRPKEVKGKKVKELPLDYPDE
jgi:hypothetical protein